MGKIIFEKLSVSEKESIKGRDCAMSKLSFDCLIKDYTAGTGVCLKEE